MTNKQIAAIGYVVLGIAAGFFLEHVLLAVFGAFGPTQPLTRPLAGDWTWCSVIGLGLTGATAFYLWINSRTHEVSLENVAEMVKGEKRASKRKFFPGYILVQMELNDRTWHLVKNTPKITGFVGNATKPPAVSEHEIARLTTQLSEGALKPKPKVEFEEGDNVRVVDGPFSNFNGTVEEVNPDKGRVRVLVSIFGRATPVELDFMQVEKT